MGARFAVALIRERSSSTNPQPENTMKTEWRYLGSVSVDAGCLMVCDPCYVTGPECSLNQAKPGGWSQFCGDHFKYGDGVEDNREVSFPLGHPGLGVVASTRHGDGHYPVYGLYPVGETSSQRPLAMMVVTGDVTDLPSLAD